MTAGLVAIHLHGPLADRFGPLHHLAVRSPREAIVALDANYPGFLAAFIEHERYAIVADDDVRLGDEAGVMPFGRELHMAPIIEGRAPIAGALLGAAFPILATTTFLGVSAATILGTILVTGLLIGASLLLTSKTPDKEDTPRDENYAFTGPENVSGQGVAVPLIYGRVFCGSVVISAGLELATELAPSSHPTTSALAARRGVALAYPDPPVDIPPPPGGWPAIVEGGPDGPQPAGWVIATNLHVIELDGSEKFLVIWEPDPQPDSLGVTYAWNELQGYYALERVQPVADYWLEPEVPA
jgi:predicted phage tail protein